MDLLSDMPETSFTTFALGQPMLRLISSKPDFVSISAHSINLSESLPAIWATRGVLVY